jgi:hypothetical protein
VLDYKTWPEKSLSATTLQLDPKNPRLPAGEELGQRELIAELVENDDVYELAKDIAGDGYSPLENLIGLEEDDKVFIVEGNRRLASLKLLINPDLAPERHVKRFRALAAGVSDPTKKVRVVIAPSREAAAPLLMRKHTRAAVARWSTLQQARYYKTLVREGMSLKRVAEQYGGTAGEIAEALRINALYEMACGLDLPDEIRAKVHNPREFPATVLTRLFGAPAIRELLGVEFSDEGTVKGKIHPDEFRRVYTRILTEIASGEADSRVLDKVPDMLEWVKGLGSDLPDPKRKGSFDPGDIAAGKAVVGGAKAATFAPAKAARAPRKSKSVVPTGTRCTVADDRIRDIFEELKRLPVETLRNSSAVMMRILLDLAVGHYMSKTGKVKPIIAAERESLYKRKKQHLPRDWFPGLRELMSALISDPDFKLHPQAHRQVQRMLKRDESSFSLDDLNAYVHSPYVEPSPTELRAAWKTLEEIFEVVLHEPVIPVKP